MIDNNISLQAGGKLMHFGRLAPAVPNYLATQPFYLGSVPIAIFQAGPRESLAFSRIDNKSFRMNCFRGN
jgi:hypothetical protein